MNHARLLSVVAALVALSGCESAPAKPEPWEMHGSRLIGCCCTPPCPCRINKKPTHCHG